MANAMYDSGRERFLGGDEDWDADDYRIILTDAADYTKDLATHDFLDDVAAGARVAVSGALTSKSKAAGVADAADVTLSTVTGDQSEQIILYQHSGVDATSALILNIDTATGLPVTPNGGDITVQWDSGANRIFKL